MSGSSMQKWDPRQMFDLSPREMDIVEKRKQMVTQKRNEFRVRCDPKAGGYGGHVVSVFATAVFLLLLFGIALTMSANRLN